MLKRTVKKNGDELFPLGLGAMRLPTKNNSIDKDLAREFILYAIDNGINYIDTAYAYHGGESESFLGDILSLTDSDGVKYRDKVKLSTKSPSWMVRSREDFDAFLNEQLRRLKTDCIDYYYLHTIDLSILERLKGLGVYEFLEKARSEGKIKNIGFSYHGAPNEFNDLIDDYDWDMVLVQYNYLDVNAQAGIRGIRYAYENDVAVFIMEPLKGGILAGELPKEVDGLFKGVDSNKSSVDWALSWVLNQKEVTCVLSGMGSIEQIKENMNIAERVEVDSLSDDELAVLEKAQGIFNSMMKINCTGCGYCLPCPKGVNIPDCFNIYNEKYLFNKKAFGPIPGAMVNYYMVVGGITNKQSNAGLCNHCGRCKRLCPQSLDIPSHLDSVKSEFEKFGFNYQIKFIRNIAMPSINKISKVFDVFKHS
ncbi:oxidoreductase aldo/keto reductase family [Methanobrevibacter ruminantium M1]|uniref:Oxidoreductase aldo/keto reductase family n=1 Tax=Methanobrevibacter ruminantium (strain ATCC 35063 / DSM 1093 / JCM 13430 / OCM 146 / M1) TaxID=634498 RepID=D3E0M1_METRM|nr:aldo/keto reductase [Methanobrevibacter ruminantium]ADC46267.1 oxidoreductase aldo/keto reductase family [Methanobrevibacter ruminantium M1]